MMTEREKKLTGTGLVVVGTLFLLVTNHVLIGWEHVWPLFPAAFGVALLRAFRSRGNPNLLIAGVAGASLGAFFLLFAFEMLDWNAMDTLWPAVPLIAGASLLAGHFAPRARQTAIPEVALVLFGLVALLFTTGRIDPRVAAPFLSFWPLALVLAGVVILKMQRDEPPAPRGAPDPDMAAVRAVMEDVADETLAPR